MRHKEKMIERKKKSQKPKCDSFRLCWNKKKMRLLGLITTELEAIANLFLGAGLPADGGKNGKKIYKK